jgi:hypothetical protein
MSFAMWPARVRLVREGGTVGCYLAFGNEADDGVDGCVKGLGFVSCH